MRVGRGGGRGESGMKLFIVFVFVRYRLIFCDGSGLSWVLNFG